MKNAANVCRYCGHKFTSAILLVTTALLLIVASTLAAAPDKLPSTAAEWRAMFDKDHLDPKKKTSRPETQRVKILIFFSLSMCQMRETMAALKLQAEPKSALAEYESARNCAAEGVAALKKQLPKARQELSRAPRAVDKLNSYAAAYLSAMSVIPRSERSDRALEILQRQDKRNIQDKEAELDVELL